MQEMSKTFCSVDEEVLRRALACSEDSKEFATELLTVHDANLGRTTRKNKMWAETLELAIRNADLSIKELRTKLFNTAD